MLKRKICIALCTAMLAGLLGGVQAFAASITAPVTGWEQSFWQRPDNATDLTEGGTGVEITDDAAWVQNGSGALHVWTEKSMANLNSQAVQQVEEFQEGKNYRLTGKIYISSSSWGFGLYLGNTRLTMLRDVIDSGSWVDIDYTFTFTGTSKDFKLQVAQGGDLYTDDLSLTEILADGSGPNLLENGDFEADFLPAGEVSDLQAAAGDQSAQLSWRNPQNSNLAAIAIFNGDTLLLEVGADQTNATVEGLENGVDYTLTVKTKTNRDVLSEGVTVQVRPYKILPLPKIIKDDTENRIIGLTEEMEYSTDAGQTWTAFDGVTQPDLRGDVTVWVRYIADDGTEAPVQVLYFTENAETHDEIAIQEAVIEGNTFRLDGKLRQAAETPVTMLLIKSGADRRDLSAVLAVGETKSGPDGSFSFEKSLADARNGADNDGTYTAYVDSNLTESVSVDGLVFVNSGERGDALAALFAQFDAALFEKDSTYYDAYRAMGFPLEEYLANTAAKSDTIAHLQQLLSELDQTAPEIQELAAEAFIQAYVMSALERTDTDGAYQLLKQYGSALQLQYSDEVRWETLETVNPGALAWVPEYMAGKSYEEIGSLNHRFCEAYALYFINAATYGNISDIIAAQEDILDLKGTYYNSYMALQADSTRKIEANKRIVAAKTQQPFSSSADVLEAIEEAMNVPTQGGGGGSTGGNGSSGETGSSSSANPFSPPITDMTNENGNEPQPEAFDDLEAAAWAKDSILYLYERGIVNGYGDGKFHPENPVTREEFVTLLVSAFALADDSASADFADVPEDAWYYRAVASAVEAGVVSGIGAGRFGTGQQITREDLSVMAYRCMGMQDSDTQADSQQAEFTDWEQISPYAREAVAAMKQLGIINGYEDGSFGPKNTATRAEASKILHAIMEMREGQ